MRVFGSWFFYFQSYFPTQHKREREDGASLAAKRPKVTFKAVPKVLKPPKPKASPVKRKEIKEPDPPPEPSPKGEDAPPNEEKREIVTSLFMGNPAIPYIPESNVTRLSEKVFSEEAFSAMDLAPQIVSFYCLLPLILSVAKLTSLDCVVQFTWLWVIHFTLLTWLLSDTLFSAHNLIWYNMLSWDLGIFYAYLHLAQFLFQYWILFCQPSFLFIYFSIHFS